MKHRMKPQSALLLLIQLGLLLLAASLFLGSFMAQILDISLRSIEPLFMLSGALALGATSISLYVCQRSKKYV